MLSIELELVDSLSGCIQRVWVLTGYAVVLEYGHVVIVSDRGSHASVVWRCPEEPEVEILAVAHGHSDTTSLDGLSPMTQMSLDIHAVGQRDRD